MELFIFSTFICNVASTANNHQTLESAALAKGQGHGKVVLSSKFTTLSQVNTFIQTMPDFKFFFVLTSDPIPSLQTHSQTTPRTFNMIYSEG